MAEAYVDKVANELADLALADQKASGDIAIVDLIGDVLGASSQTLQETYLTAVRVRRAEERARKMLAERKANGYADAPKPQAAPLQGLPEDDSSEIPEDIAATTADAPAPDGADNGDSPQQPATPATGMPRRVTR